MNRRNSDNRGLTLIELIVVVAILGIVSFGAMNYFGLLHGASAKEAATKLNTAMNKTRTEAMSKAQASLLLYRDSSDSSYYVILVVNDKMDAPIRIGGSRVKMTYTDSASAVKDVPTITVLENMTLDDYEAVALKIDFNRDTGGFKPIQTGASEIYCKQITISSGSKTYKLICEKLTGKIRVE